MKNRELFNQMTDEELSAKLCDVIESIADKADVDDMCDICPVNKLCKKGHNGFLAYLTEEASVI